MADTSSLKEIIDKHILIENLAEDFGVKLVPAFSGEFDYCCKCPSLDHKNGSEQTPSFFISSAQNRFYCFGCNASGGSLSFYMLCAQCDFQTALSDLKQDVENFGNNQKQERRKNNIDILISISSLLRTTMLENKNDLKWMSQFMQKLDQHLENIKFDDIEKATALRQKVISLLNKRYAK